MKNSIFARPNLKVFLLGAMLIVVVQALIGGGGQEGMASGTMNGSSSVSWTGDIDALTREALEHPSSSVFLRISHYYEKKRDYKRAIQYLQKAERFAQWEEMRQ
jgi:hypothetical protein